LLELFWHITFVLLVAASFFYVTALVITLAGSGLNSSRVIYWCVSLSLQAILDGTLAVVVRQSYFRVSAQGWLSRRGGKVGAAAIVAALVGGQDPSQVLKKASALFRAVKCDQVTREMMSDNKPNPALHALSRSARLGSVDAFLSHSWHDPSDAKWEAIQNWRASFKLAHHREPLLWIDKFCIDQTNINDNLLCLPVFLSGCKRLLVLAGDTYLTRLWCIVELFVFLQMGGSPGDIRLRDLEDVHEQVATFDANMATCFDPDDKQHLLSIVEAGSDGMDTFNAQVQGILLDALAGGASGGTPRP